MTARPRLEKALEELKRNPYFDKYAQKIAKLQQTDPDEFLQRVESEEKKICQKKDPTGLSSSYNMNYSSIFAFLRPKPRPCWNHLTHRNYSDSAPKSVYITTPIFYVNSAPHIGHLYTALLADTLCRYNAMRGSSVHLCTGTDEHGNKVQKAAEAAKLPIGEYCTQVSMQFREMCDKFNVQYSKFIRTTDSDHQRAVHHFWNTLEERGHIYLGKYSGWYCMSDEAFLSNTEIIEKQDASGNPIKVSALSENLVEWTEEDNYKFRLSAFQDDLRHWLKNTNVVAPLKFHRMLSQMIEDGACLQDVSVSRLAERVPWAIPTPCDESQSIYVWLDALVNYLTAVGYPDESFKQFWPPAVHVIGKDILKFHGVFWPAFLIAAGLEPPRQLLCHAHWMVHDSKMSKSKGNVISPFTAAKTFTEDGLRYFLLRKSVPDTDANYSERKIMGTLNAELSDTLGNLVSRCFGKALNKDREIPDPSKYIGVLTSESATKNIKALWSLPKHAEDCYASYNLHHLGDAVMSTLHSANEMVQHHEPWNLVKSDDPNSTKELKAVLAFALETTRVSALVLFPIIPRLASDLLDFLQVPMENRTWADTTPLSTNSNKARHATIDKNVLFRKISCNI